MLNMKLAHPRVASQPRQAPAIDVPRAIHSLATRLQAIEDAVSRMEARLSQLESPSSTVDSRPVSRGEVRAPTHPLNYSNLMAWTASQASDADDEMDE